MEGAYGCILGTLFRSVQNYISNLVDDVLLRKCLYIRDCGRLRNMYLSFHHEFISMEHEHEVLNLDSSGMRWQRCHLYLKINVSDKQQIQFKRISLTSFPAQSVRSSNAIALDSLYLLVLITGVSQTRQHGQKGYPSCLLPPVTLCGRTYPGKACLGVTGVVSLGFDWEYGHGIALRMVKRCLVIIDHEYQNCPLRFDDKIRSANLFPLDMNDFDIKFWAWGAYGCILGGGYRAVAPGFYQTNNANPSYQERRQSMEDTLSKFMSESVKRHEENSNLIKEIRASTDAAIRNQGASIKTLEIQIGQMSKVLQERGFGSLPISTEANPRDQVKSISTTIEADSYPIRRIGSSQYAVSTGQNRTLIYETRQTKIPFPSRLNGYYCEEKKGSYGPQFLEAYSEASHINNSIPRKEKDPGSFTLPCFINNVCFDNALVDLGASVSVMPLSTYLNLGLGKLAHTKLTVELADRTVKYPKGIAENVLVGIGKFTFPIDFIILDMPEDIKVPLILGRPFLSTARAKIDVYKRKITLRVGEERIVFTSVKPTSSLIKRVYMLNPFFEDYIELNDLNKPFELRRNQGDDLISTIEEGEVIEEFRTRDDELDAGIDDYPNYCDYDKKIHIDFLENMDAYRDEEMGNVIFGELFLREVEIKTRRFEGMITIYNGNDEVTYQMVRSHESITVTQMMRSTSRGPRERNVDEYWWRIYKSGDLEVLES
ncbi:mitochondrial proton/calcium exchanger protein-like protein isoform X1 [Tanacetum coccineum]